LSSNEVSMQSKRQEISNLVKMDFAKDIEDKGFRLAGIGGSERQGKTTGFELAFSTDDLYNVDIARKHLVEIAKQFLNKVDEDTELKPYLCQHPFPIENMKLTVFPKDQSYNGNFNLSSVLLSAGKIYYFAHGDSVYDRFTVLEETYEEALKIVAAYKEGELNSIAEYQALSK